MKETLIERAKKAQEKAHVPYSNFRVGAALLTEDGKIYEGCNIEVSSFSLTCCAERTAIFKAVSEGEKQFKAIAVIGDSEGPVSPCGACRQVMADFFDEHMKVYLTNHHNEIKEMTVAQLLPYSFSLDKL
ncbi:cytidine deaminase [Pseudogracilibacillus sp. SO10305]|uniref:cytidine deaminase n=1 Tax=Pseudogracilibacillus sp. SO10305 TaxID=3098292 RepID=UPI00300DBE75